MGNPFVQLQTTGEVGRIDLQAFDKEKDIDTVEVHFYDSPSKSSTRICLNSDLKQFIPAENGILWIPIVQEIVGRKTRIYHRGTFRFVHDDGRWAVILRYLNSAQKPIETFVDPQVVTILRSGRTMDVVSCLGDMLTMSTKYAATRQRLLNDLYSQLKVARGYRSILSSGVRPFVHQINTMVRVMSDPIPRFILADEVGLGKTIEAGLIIRQTLIDNPKASITIVCPDFLIGQWTEEMEVKLHLSQWFQSGQIKIVGFNSGSKIVVRDVLVVDEAHQITSEHFQYIYDQISSELKPSTTLLLLTATPMRGNRIDFLKLLHLVDPGTYSLDDLDKFEERLELREKTARLIDALRDPTLPKEILADYLSRLGQFFSEDVKFKEKTDQILERVNSDKGVSELQIDLAVYLRETYRIARRVIRNRRDVVAENGYLVAGRELKGGQPELVEEISRPSIDGFITLFLRRLNELEANGVLDFAEVLQIADPVIEGALSSPEVFVAQLTDSELITDIGMFGPELVDAANEISKEISNFGPSNRWKSVMSICRAHIQNGSSKGVVVFMRNEKVARLLHEELSKDFGAHQVVLHVESMSTGEQDQSVAQFVSTGYCRVLIMDQSGEEGRNLQYADEIVHFSLPLSPNHLEQRLGRSDRFKERIANRAVSTVFLEEFSSLSAGQFEYLNNGLNIFQRSVATAQQFLTHEYENLFRRLLSDGLDAFSGDCDEIAAELQEEMDVIFSVDEIESSGVPEEFTLRDFENLVELDQDSEVEKHALGLLVKDSHRNPPTSAIGLALAPSQWQKQDLTQTMRLALQTPFGDPIDLHGLDSKRKIELQNFVLEDCEYAFSRPVVQRLPGARIFRVGDPFVDWIIDYIEGDELGRTWAVWRRSNSKISLLSGTVKVGLSKNSGQFSSVWGEINAQRRLELVLPPQLLHVAVAQGKVIDHDEPKTKKVFPWASLVDTNFGDEQWKKAGSSLEGFKNFCKSAETSIISHTRQRVQQSEEFQSRRIRAEETHQSIMSILEIDAGNSNSPTHLQSTRRLEDERKIHRLVTEVLDDPPIEILSLGLIYMSPEKP